MLKYSNADLELIAASIERNFAEVVPQRRSFNAGAHWYELDCGLPYPSAPRTPPSKLRDKLQQLSKAARRLLNHLGVREPADAYDGPGNFELLTTLAWAESYDEDAIVTATRRVGRLAEIVEAVAALSAIEQCSEAAAEDVQTLTAHTGRPGHQGNEPVNAWIATMMGIYSKITGNEPATSVGGAGQPNEGIASGPLIRFLAAAGKPLGFNYSEDGWRSRVRTILKSSKS